MSGTEVRPYFSVFIPTYNRASTLPRALESVRKQSVQDLELVVVDDGSTDDTEQLVRDFAALVPFPVRYTWQPNQGKHAAHNTALTLLRGHLTVILDSDDLLVPDALERLQRHWEAIPDEQREQFLGVKGLCKLIDGAVMGHEFPKAWIDADDLTIRAKWRLGGDKVGAVRTEILQDNPYPVTPGERHLRPSYLWKRLAHRYRVRFINEIIQECEHQPGGLSSDRFRLRMRNPNSYREYHLADIRDHAGHLGRADLLDGYGKYIRYSLHAKVGWARLWCDAPRKGLLILTLPEAIWKYAGDRVRVRAKGLS